MKSFIAALRSLVLPFGQTSGARIILDGTNGRIEIYDSLDDLIIRIDGTDGIVLFDSSGAERLQLQKPATGFGSPIVLSTGSVAEILPGFISTATGAFGGQDVARLSFSPPEVGNDNLTLSLFSVEDPALAGEAALVLFDSSGLDAGGHVFYDFANNFSSDNTDGGVVVSDDFWIGNNAGNSGAPPTKRQSLPRGVIALGTSTTDVTLSTTAGTFSDIVLASNVAVEAGRRYRIIADGGHSFASAGSGFAVGDAWDFNLQRDEGAGYGALTVPAHKRVRANVAVATRFPIPVMIGYYEPAADDTVSFKLRATKSSGAATVTTSVQVGAELAAFTISVEDVGEA